MNNFKPCWLLLGLTLMTIVMLGSATTGRAQLPNIVYWYAPEWDYPFCPTDGLHTPPEVRVPAVLPGNQSTIYLHFLGWNDGTAATPTGFHGDLILDGVHIGDYSAGIINPGNGFYAVDVGPTWVRGGRHTLEIQHDSLHEITESNENDNNWAHQFIFSPLMLADASPVIRNAPPDRDGGWSSIVDGSTIDVNCDGFRFSSTGWWNVVTVRALDTNDDYDCYLYDPSSGSEDGFTGPLAGSTYIAGYLDAVVVNRNVEGIHDFDVGAVNWSGGTSQFAIEKVTSQSFSSGDSILVHFNEGEFLKVWDTYIWPDDAGLLTVEVDIVSGEGSIVAGVYDWPFAHGGLTDLAASQTSDEHGHVRLYGEFAPSCYYGLVLYLNPIDGGGAGMDVTLELKPSKPDIRPAYLPGWAAPLVPRPLPDGNPEWVPAPDTLLGYVPETYFNVALENASPVGADTVYAFWYRDGRDYWASVIGSFGLGPYEPLAYNQSLPLNIPGGRHTYTLQVGLLDPVGESLTDNNVYGEQFCWSPLEIPEGAVFELPYPATWDGGLWSVTTGEPLYINCDGYRVTEGSGWWQGIVLNQSGWDDYDLVLYDPLAGTKNGFAAGLAGSYWVEGFTDYVLVNNNLVGQAIVDVGVNNYLAGASDNYTVEHVSSQSFVIGDVATLGPYEMVEARMLHLFDIYLEADVYTFALDNLAGGVDFGMSLHPADLEFLGRTDVLPGGQSWLNGPGGDEWMSVTVPSAGWYCLAVCKNTPADFPLVGVYRLRAGRGPVGVPQPGQDQIPEVTALTGVYPNPFNPRTTIAFDLSNAGPVELAVYDLQGACVRRLVRADLPSGRHEVVWDGTDDCGRRVASGVYMTRLQANGKVGLKKMVMLK